MFAKSRLALLVGWVTGSVAFPLLAQDAQKTDTVVVTSQMQSAATKLETPDIETPQSVSIVTREQFEERGSTATRSGRQTALTTWCCAVSRTAAWTTSTSTA